MASATPPASAVETKIKLSECIWSGPVEFLDLKVQSVVVELRNARTQVSVMLPDSIDPSRASTLPFTTLRPPATESVERKEFRVAADKVTGMTLRVAFLRGTTTEVTPSLPVTVPTLVHNAFYTLVVQSTPEIVTDTAGRMRAKLDFGAVIQRFAPEPEESTTFRGRVRRMGEALVGEGVETLRMARTGTGPTTPGGAFDHMLGGVIRAGQHVTPGIRMPTAEPEETLEDLMRLEVDTLHNRFHETFIRDKELERQSAQAAIAGNSEEVERIIGLERVNSKLLMLIGEALKNKGETPRIPTSPAFQAAASATEAAHREAFGKIVAGCAQQ